MNEWINNFRRFFTAPLRVSDGPEGIQAELNNLPTIYPDTVTVTSESANDGAKFTITFVSETGELINPNKYRFNHNQE